MRLICLGGIIAAGLLAYPVLAADCPGNPDALGTARTIVVDPAQMPRIGRMSYPETLPLEPKEVVLTFDDGPQPKYTRQVLDTLERECVKATFFLIGELAKLYPDWVQREARAGHSIGNHTQTHPRYVDKLSFERATKEIDDAARNIEAALAPAGYKMAPFFRFPGFRHTDALDQYVNKQGYAAIGADFPADDWIFIGPEAVMRRALERLEKRGSGILLLHDIHQRTATILPKLLRELKTRGYKVVHIVPATGAPEPVASAESVAAPSSAQVAPKDAAPKETAGAASTKDVSAEGTTVQRTAAAAVAPRHRHVASLRRPHRATRHAAARTGNQRNLRDTPD
jgi:peptidoglycan-N-acetylglucosamine deacetylase